MMGVLVFETLPQVPETLMRVPQLLLLIILPSSLKDRKGRVSSILNAALLAAGEEEEECARVEGPV